ncbi:DUF6082 family protein [Nonomuraea sp. NPDC001636]|uniref:DUF6082 family protein n=1 Tax=Nonomuraea sp. NPDC001636 TaxID=3154391 RepID=UPI00331F1F21
MTILAAIVAFSVIAAMLILSPIALRTLSSVMPPAEWTLLSEIGQAYGPVATLLAALSLAGIAYSALLQARSVRVMTDQNWRLVQFELIRTGLEKPALVQVTDGLWRSPKDDASIQMLILANAWTNHWRSMHDLGLMEDAELRHHAKNYFDGEVGRKHWETSRDSYRVAPRSRKFCKIMDEELAKANRSKARPLVYPKTPSAQRQALMAFGAGAVLAFSLALHARQRR